MAQYTGIALRTAITFLTLSIGVLAATRDTSPVSILASQRPGGILARRLVLSIIALPLTLGYVRILGQRANLYDTGLGAALFAVTLIAIFGAMVWRTAIQLDDTDRAREAAQHTADETEDQFRALANASLVSSGSRTRDAGSGSTRPGPSSPASGPGPSSGGRTGCIPRSIGSTPTSTIEPRPACAPTRPNSASNAPTAASPG